MVISANQKKVLLFLVAAVSLGVCTLICFRWANERDYPAVEGLEVKGTIYYQSKPLEVTLDCDCPKNLTESIPRPLVFTIHLKSAFADSTSSSAAIGTPAVPESIFVKFIAANTKITPDEPTYITPMALAFSGTDISKNVPITITALDATLTQIALQFEDMEARSLGTVSWSITSRSSAKAIITPVLYALAVSVGLLLIFFWADWQTRRLREHAQREFNDAKKKAQDNPKEARYAWDVARVTLEQYFGRNLIQVNLVFWVAVLVMMVGFGFIIAGVLLSFHQASVTPPSWVAAISGLITQFIGATFMVIYRSTMVQAGEFVIVLDRINRVGMAVQVLDAIDEGELKNKTRATIATSLMNTSVPSSPQNKDIPKAES
jgi:hypothetical protein